jgi:hypothetical protein
VPVLKRVPQRKRNGCGVSAVGCVLGLRYEEAAECFTSRDGNDTTRGFSCQALVRVLTKQGRPYRHIRFRRGLSEGDKRAQVKAGTIVRVLSTRPDWNWFIHYLVRGNGVWIDGTDKDWKEGSRRGKGRKGGSEGYRAAKKGRRRRRLPSHYKFVSYLEPVHRDTGAS